MNQVLRLISIFLATASAGAMAQSVIYRCGNEYLNDAVLAESRGCKVIEGGNVTLVPGTRVNPTEAEASGPAAASVPGRSLRRSAPVNVRPTTEAAMQRSRDSDARSILLAELKTAEARLADQQIEYNQGQPEKLDLEIRQPQRYRDRVSELKDAIHRYAGDIAGLKREIARLPTPVSLPSQ